MYNVDRLTVDTSLAAPPNREIPWEEYTLVFEILSGQTERGQSPFSDGRLTVHSLTSVLSSLLKTERNKIDAVTKSQLLTFLLELVSFTDQHKSNS